MVVIDENIWPQLVVGEKLPPDRSTRISFSDFVLSSRRRLVVIHTTAPVKRVIIIETWY